VHTISTFKTWQPPSTPFDLIIAVSFGLFIPASMILSLPFGGLNVHPSLLPRYRGAAPIQRTLLNLDRETGVTIQTLDPQRFDHGSILLQTSPPLRVAKDTSYKALHDTLAEQGAEMLVETLRRGLFIPPLEPVEPKYQPSMARKVTPEDEHIVWDAWTAHEMQLRAEMFGSVWTELGSENAEDTAPRKRTILSGIRVLDWKPPAEMADLGLGCFRYVKREQPFEELMVLRCKEGWVRVGAVKVESKKEIEGGTWIRSLQKRGVGRKFW
jgi:methionyl-tRNA formyltransferase